MALVSVYKKEGGLFDVYRDPAAPGEKRVKIAEDVTKEGAKEAIKKAEGEPPVLRGTPAQ